MPRGKPIELASTNQFLETYRDGVEVAATYQEAMELLHDGLSKQEVADRVGRNIRTVYNWGSYGRRPTAVKALDQAVQQGILPLDTSNDKAIHINRLAAKVFWTGSIGINDNSRVDASISGRPEHLENLRQYFIRSLELDLREYTTPNHAASLDFSDGGALYGRLLIAMGLPQSREKKKLPQYIEDIVAAKPRPRSKANRILRDFARVLFQERFYPSDTSFWIKPHAHKTRQAARTYGIEIMKLLQACMPGIPITPTDIKVDKIGESNRPYNPTKEYKPRIRLRPQTLAHLVARDRSFLSLGRPKAQWLKD